MSETRWVTRVRALIADDEGREPMSAEWLRRALAAARAWSGGAEKGV